MKTTVTFEIETDNLGHASDSHLCALWHVAHGNPASIEDRDAGRLAEHIGREIIRRFLSNTPPELWAHQGRHADWHELMIKKGVLTAQEAAE